jgi:hypothetical protein
MEQKLTIAMAIADRAPAMVHDSIVFQGTPDSLRANAYIRRPQWQGHPLSLPRQRPLHRNIFPLQLKKNDRTFSFRSLQHDR